MTLVSIGGGHRLEARAAESFFRVSVIRPGLLSRINSSTRTSAEQRVLRTAYEVYLRGGPWAAYAMQPGTSKHNFGTALDIDSSPWNADWQWMADSGEEYGWFQTNPAEPWHFEYIAALDRHNGDSLEALTPIEEIPTAFTEDPMIIAMSTTPSTNGLIPKGMAFMIPPSGPVRPLSRREYEDYIWHRDHDQHIPVRVSMWTGDDIVKVSDPLGLMEWTGLDAGDTPHLTGRVLRYGQPV